MFAGGQRAVDLPRELAAARSAVIVAELGVEGVARRLAPLDAGGEVLDVEAARVDDLEQRAGHLRLGQLLAGDRADPLALAHELDDRRVAVEVDDPDDVVDVVAIEPAEVVK